MTQAFLEDLKHNSIYVKIAGALEKKNKNEESTILVFSNGCSSFLGYLFSKSIWLDTCNTEKTRFRGRSSCEIDEKRWLRCVVKWYPQCHIVYSTLSTPSGYITKITYKGTDNLLEENNEEGDRGYWDIDRNPSTPDTFEDRLNGTSYKVVVENENQTEISFVKTYNSNSDEDDENVPINVDKRFVMLRGSYGFYTYTVFERLEGWPHLDIVEARIVFKLKKKMSYFMAMSDVRQRIMPTEMDREKGKVLDYKEAVQLVKPSNPKFHGEVDDKYFYSCENKYNKVYGWVSLSHAPIGFWMITPSNEFCTGGPFKQDLTSHVGPTILNMFTSTHYARPNLTIKFSNGEPWKKVLGPVFVYLNSNPKAKDKPSTLWEDAKKKVLEESSKWPYEFPDSKDFAKSNERGVVRGCLSVVDRYMHIRNSTEAV